MKLFATFAALALAQDEGADRWSYYDYSIGHSHGHGYGGKMGHAVSGVGTSNHGGHEGNRRYCHATADNTRIYRWDVSLVGYFAHFNPVECIGEEIFCTIEERAQFGQIIQIRAGCAQMMPGANVEPSVEGIILSQKKTWYNKEAARGVDNWKYEDQEVNIFFGIGGCLALPVQNGWDVYHKNFKTSMQKNHYMGAHGGYSMNQCLRFQKDDAKADLLPFGTSVCRTCCLATPDYYAIYGGTGPTGSQGPCNFWPAGAAGVPTGLSETTFLCEGPGAANCSFDPTKPQDNTCAYCYKKMFPNFSMYMAPDYNTYVNLFSIDQNGSAFCDVNGNCSPIAI